MINRTWALSSDLIVISFMSKVLGVILKDKYDTDCELVRNSHRSDDATLLGSFPPREAVPRHYYEEVQSRT